MKSIFSTITLVICSCFLLTSCLKDTCTKTYAIYRPVYKTAAEVRANIRSSAPKEIRNPGKLVLYGNYIFLNEVDKGVHIIDNSNPAAPINKHFIEIPGNVDLAVKGSSLYADLYTDLVTINIADPNAVQVTKIEENVFERRRYANGFIADNDKIIVEWQKTDTMVTNECSNTWTGTRDRLVFEIGMLNSLASAPTAGINGSMSRFTLLNNYLYTVTNTGLNVFNISQPSNPVFSNLVQIGWGIETIYPFKNNLFIGSTTGMFIFGTANPAQPNQLSRFTHAQSCDPVIADDNYAYVTLRSGTNCNGALNQLDVINIQNLSAPVLLKTYPLNNPHGLSKANNTLIVCDGSGGLKVYNATNPSSLQLVQQINNLNAYDVIAVNDRAIVVAKDGLYQYQITGAFNLQILSKITYQ